SDMYCAQCGSRDLVTWQPEGLAGASTGSSTPAPATGGYILASRSQRVGAFAIDLVIGVLISLLGTIPIVNFLITLILILYWLFRDSSGASIGKRLVGLKVLSKSGQKARKSQL